MSEETLPLLTRTQPCGCVMCICEDEVRCHGCGARKCGTETCVLEVPGRPDATYQEPTAKEIRIEHLERDLAQLKTLDNFDSPDWIQELVDEVTVLRARDIEANDALVALDRETALLREYVALLEKAVTSTEAIARVHGITPPWAEVEKASSLRAAIRATRTEHDEAVVDKLFANAPRRAGRSGIAEARGEGDG